MKLLQNTTRLAIASAAALITSVAVGDQKDRADNKSTAWLGVATAPIDEVLAAQLDLPEGIGAAIKIVVPGSPAEDSGLEKNDILFELNGADVESPEHLSELVRERKAGETVALGALHRGAKKEFSVTLGERPADMKAAPQVPGAAGRLDLGDLGAFDMKLQPLGGDFADIEKRMAKMREQMEKHFEGMMDLDQLDNLPGATDFMSSSSKSVMLRDADGSIEVRTQDDDVHVTAKDTDGKVLFDGSANTEEERAKMPERVREMFEKTQKPDVGLDFDAFRFSRPKLKLPDVPDVKPGKKVEPEAEDAEIPSGKKIKI